MLTGGRIRALRHFLGMDRRQFAELLGVHPSSVHRWESREDGNITIEPLQLQILAVIHQQHELGRVELGEAVAQALRLGGTLRGLYVLLEAYYVSRSIASVADTD